VKLETCFIVSPRLWATNFALAPGETTPSAPQTAAQSSFSGSSVTAHDSALSSQDGLTDNEVKAALAGQGRQHWTSITDMGLMAAQGNQLPQISLYMPEAVLAVQAESAKKQYIPYQPTEDDKRRSLTIIAQGYAGKTIAEACTSIIRVVLLSDASGSVVKEAYMSEPLSETWRNGFWATNACQELRAKFNLSDVEQVKTVAKDGEFFVAVFSGPVKTKIYKIEKKQQENLGLQ
jgi:hypothetical protein